MAVAIPVSWGEFFDKLTILQIKRERIGDPEKLQNIETELDELTAIYRDRQVAAAGLAELVDELRRVNEALWGIEDEIRACERRRDFSAGFVALARSVYQTNDRRAEVKRRINELLGSTLIEEKSYEPY